MATVQTRWFTKGGLNLVQAEIGWVASPINVMLMKTGYVFSQDGPEVYADVSANEATGTNYSAGGTVIGTRSAAIDAATNETRLFGAAVDWPNSTIAARGGVIYANAGVKPVLGYIDFETDRTSENGLFRIEWPDPWVLRLRALT